MKKIFCLMIIGLLVFSCDKELEKPIIEKPICSTPPITFSMLIDKKSEKYKDFVDKAGNIYDKVGVYDKEGDEIKSELYPNGHEDKKNNFVVFIYRRNISFLTGKEEVLYVKNNGKDIEVKITGKIKRVECGSIGIIEKVVVDGKELKEKELGGWADLFIDLIPKKEEEETPCSKIKKEEDK